MFLDLIGPNCCTSVGIGGRLDVIANGDIQSTINAEASAVGKYRAGSDFIPGFGSLAYETVYIDVNSGFATDPENTAHEMGHAIHDALSRATIILGNSGSLAAKRETRAALEGIADINSVIYENYIKTPKFSNPNWEVLGRTISQEKVMPTSAGNDDYENGQILGYAFHQLVTRSNGVNFQAAAEIFLRSIGNLADNDDNGNLSFDEIRQAMVQTATTQAQRDAINDAFAAAGITLTQSGQGGGGSTAPPVGGVGSPGSASFVNGSLQNSCFNGVSIHQNTWASSVGAAVYDVWYSVDFINYIYSFSDTNTSELTQNTVDVDVKVSACNVSGCSLRSIDSYEQDFFCN